MCKWGVGRWQTSLPSSNYSNRRMLYVRSTRQLILQTKCRHPSRVSASKLFCCAIIISLIPNAVNRTGSVARDRGIVLCLPLQKRASSLRLRNVFDPKKRYGTTAFFCGFMWGNMIPCLPLELALSALHLKPLASASATQLDGFVIYPVKVQSQMA